MRTERLDDLRAIQLYENKTGRVDYTMDDVAKWIEEHNVMPMPVPQTPRQLLAQRLSRSAGAARRRDPESPVPYRGHLAYRAETNGQWTYRWFDADSPAATPEKMKAATQSRREQALSIGVQVTADWDHYYRTHPTVEREMPSFDLDEEIGWRIAAQTTTNEEIEHRKAG